MEKEVNIINQIEDEEFDEFLNYLVSVKEYSENTKFSYAYDIAEYLLFISTIPITKDEVSRTHAKKYLLYLNNKNISKSSIKRRLCSLRSFYKYLVKYKKYEVNPFETITSIKGEKKLPQYLNEKEVNELLNLNMQRDDFFKERDQAILELLFASGLRASEIISLSIKNIDFDNKLLIIFGKGRKERIIPFNNHAKDAMISYINNTRKELLLKNKDNDKDQYILFLNKNGKRLTTRGLEYLIKQISIKTGFNLNIHPHMLRHSFATELLNNGADLLTIKELMGHSSIETTSIYAHVNFTDLKNTYDKCFDENKTNPFGVIFDFNGTMFFDTKEQEEAWTILVKKHFNIDLKKEDFKLIHGYSTKESLERLSNTTLDDDYIELLRNERIEIYKSLCYKNYKKPTLVPGLKELLIKLNEKDIPIAICTSSTFDPTKWYISTFELYKYFSIDNIFYIDESIKRAKPSPDIFLKAIKKMKLDEYVIFEDSYAGVIAAYKANAKHIIQISEDKNNQKFEQSDFLIYDYNNLSDDILKILHLL